MTSHFISHFGKLRGTEVVCAALFLLATCVAAPGRAEFTTIINSPPVNLESLSNIDSNTQLNMFEGAVVSDLDLGGIWEPSQNIELNMFGGEVQRDVRSSGGWVSNSDVTINIRGGIVRGSVGADNGNKINVLGGEIGEAISVGTGAVASISGGSFGSLAAGSASGINLIGGEFRLNGALIPGLATPGASVALNVDNSSVLTGTLTDGTPVAIAAQGYFTDAVADGALHLISAPTPAAIPGLFHGDETPALRGLRAGQQLILTPGHAAPKNFVASHGSAVTVAGGSVGDHLRAVGAIVNVAGGTIGERGVALAGAVVNLNSGVISSNFNVGAGAKFNMSGGSTGWLFEALPGSDARIAGGKMGRLFNAHAGSRVAIVGSEFRIDGVPINGLNVPGATRQLDLPAGAVLSGTYADGRQFVYSTDRWDYFAPGTLTLESVAPPAPGAAVIRVPSDPSPVGLRNGQMLFVSDGGAVDDNFTAGRGSVVNIDGGRLGGEFEAVGALVNITGGVIGWGFNTFYGTVANVSGGTFEGYVQASRGSVINVSGGKMTYIVTAAGGGIVNVSGGSLAETGYVNVYDGSTFNVSGGGIGDTTISERSAFNLTGGQIRGPVHVSTDSVANFSGGTLSDELSVGNGSRLLLTGSDFRINGDLIPNLQTFGLSVPVEIPDGAILSGTFDDGTPFAFSASDRDYFDVDSVRLLQSWNAPPPQAPTIDLPTGPAPTGVRGSQTVFVEAAHPLGDNFNAGWGSAVTMTGGAVGRNFEAVGAQVLIAGGTVGPGFDAFHGSIVTITGGAIGDDLTAHAGSIVNVTGGQFAGEIKAGFGSIVSFTGGDIDGSIEVIPGSTVNIVGSRFSLNGETIPGLVLGQATPIMLTGNSSLYGFLASGSPFDLRFDAYRPPNLPPAPTTIVTLTLVPDSDLDYDGVVTSADLFEWKSYFSRYSYGDADGDLDTDGADFLIWQRQLGTRRRVFDDPVAVPEPASAVLAGLISLSGLLVARRWRS